MPTLFCAARCFASSAVGFGSLALASLLADESRAEAGRGQSARRQAAAFSRAGQAGHLPVHERRAVAGRYVRLQAAARRATTASRCRSPSRACSSTPTGNLLKSPWKFQQYGESGTVGQRAVSARGQARRRPVHHPLGARHEPGPRRGAAEAAHRQRQVRPAQHGLVGQLRPGNREREPAGFVTICPTLAHGGVNNWSSAFLPAAYQGTPLGNASVPVGPGPREVHRQQPSCRATFSGCNSICSHAMNREHLAQSRPGAVARSPDQLVRAGLPHADRAARGRGPVRRDRRRRRSCTASTIPITANFGRQCLMARRFAEAGVRFIQVTHSDSNVQWDQHGDLKDGHAKNAREVDQPIAGLLHDLKARGLLDDTLVWWGGEFGRTPTAAGQRRPRPQSRRLHDVAGRRRRERRASATARPTTTATSPPRTRSTSTTCTPRSCTCWASTTNG